MGFSRLFVVLAASLAVMSIAHGAESIGLVSPRHVYFSNEPIALWITAEGAAPANLTLHEENDSTTLTISVPASGANADSRLVTIVPGALEPGTYTAQVGKAEVSFKVAKPEHANAYFTAPWNMNAKPSPGVIAAKGGWMFFNSDLVSSHPWQMEQPAHQALLDSYVAASMHPFALMVCGGGHQLDLKPKNDWGDPWIQRAVIWRMNLGALANRPYPLAGLHVFDEPGLTWWPIKGAKIGNPYCIPHQIEEFRRKTGVKMPYGGPLKTLPQYQPMMSDWLGFMDMRMEYLEQAWYASVWGTRAVDPSFLTINQVSSSYAPGKTTDGVDSRQARPYRVISGHGGYSDLWFGTFEPVCSAEGYQGFTRGRPHYFLPMWYTHTPATIRNGVWMSFAVKLEGMMYPPTQRFDFKTNNDLHAVLTAFEIAEINRRLARIGGVFKQLPKSLAPVAVLHSSRQYAYDLAKANHPKPYSEGPAAVYRSLHHDAVRQCFFRVMETGMIPNWIDESEAVAKGADFLSQWKVIYCPGLATATDPFQAVLTQYVKDGGILIQYADDPLHIPGAVRADYKIGDLEGYWRQNVKGKGAPATLPAYRDLAMRKWNRQLAPGFEKDLARWLGPQAYDTSNNNVLLGVHRAGKATYLLFANNAEDPANPRKLKRELIPAQTQVKLPQNGVVYDLIEGGQIPVTKGHAPLRLPSGGGAAWIHLPQAPGPMQVSARVEQGQHLRITVRWGTNDYLPFRLRVIDPSGRERVDWFRATAPTKDGGASQFTADVDLGINARSGTWRVQASQWLTTGRPQTVTAEVPVAALAKASIARLDDDRVSIYFDDAQKITDLLAGKPLVPPYDKMNWDSKRVFGVNQKTFAIFGDDAPAKRLAKALRAKGMTVQVNPAYDWPKKIAPEPGHGIAGPRYGVDSYESIKAHAIVLPGSDLIPKAIKRGQINYPTRKGFPGKGRANIQWGMSCFQAGWQDVFVMGDAKVGVDWLIKAMQAKPTDPRQTLNAEVSWVEAPRAKLPATWHIASEQRVYDTPVGVAQHGALFVALYDGSVARYDDKHHLAWRTDALLEAHAMAVSPDGSRLAVAGYPGLIVLDAATGKVLGGYRAAPADKGLSLLWANTMRCVAWSDDSKIVAGGWSNNHSDPQPLVILDANGRVLRKLDKVGGKRILGAAFVPGTHVLLVGGAHLVAVDADTGHTAWSAPVGGAWAFAFSADGKTVAAGGWKQNVARVQLSDGKVLQHAKAQGIIGGVAITPSGDLIVAAWGGTQPLWKLPADSKAKLEPFFQGRFAFENVRWSKPLNGLVASEQGGTLWLLSANGEARARLDADAGTTIRAMDLVGSKVIVGRMDHSVQILTVKP